MMIHVNISQKLKKIISQVFVSPRFEEGSLFDIEL